jgi:monoamine oxidase
MTRCLVTGHRLAPTRRATIAGLIASAALPGMARRAFAADADVAIIGAGAAGISAARELQRLGRSFVLIEARARIGGRAHTDASLGHGFDAGAQIIHFAQENPWVGIARELGAALDESGGRMGGWQVFAGGRPLGPLERARRWQAFRSMEAAMERVAAAGKDMSLAEAVAGLDQEQREIARSGLLLVLGEDGERISVLDNQQLWSGPDYTTRDGYGALVAAYGRGLPVSLSTPASHVRWGEGGVTVETPSGAIRARAAIITVPVGVLKAGAIRFTPELPDSHRAALDGIGMGALTKIALRLEGDRFGLSDETVLMDGTRAPAMTMIEMYPDGKPLAVAVCGGDFARGLGAAGEAAAIAHVADLLAGMLGAAVRRQVRGGRLASWWADPLSRGAYSVCAPGHAAARAALAAPVAGRLWFAGEATAGGASMTVGGATLSARKAVGEIAVRLRA